MERIKECYQSLENAKSEIAMLNRECDEMEQFIKGTLNIKTSSDLYMSFPDLITKYDAQHKENKKIVIKIFGLWYPIGIVIIFIISLILKFQPAPFISCFSSILVSLNVGSTEKLFTSKKKIKLVNKLANYCKNKSELDGLDLDQINRIFMQREQEYSKIITSKREDILEYEKFLEKCEIDVANQVLVDEGIDATIEMGLVPKAEKKKLIKVNVNK